MVSVCYGNNKSGLSYRLGVNTPRVKYLQDHWVHSGREVRTLCRNYSYRHNCPFSLSSKLMLG